MDLVTPDVEVVDVSLLDRQLRLKSFSPMTSGSVARCSRPCCAVVVFDAEVVIDEVQRLVLATLVVDVDIAVLVFSCTGRDHNSRVGGHPLDQSVRGTVFMTLTACGCSFR